MTATNKHAARVVALQALYELDMTNHYSADILTARLEETPLEAELHTFSYSLVSGVQFHRGLIDRAIEAAAPDFPLDQIALVDRNVLRIAIYEWIIGKHTPIKVAIDEAVELGKEFGSESSSRFINGVLGTLADNEQQISLELGKS